MPQQWFIGVYFCPGGTSERPCDYQIKSRESIIKHIEKNHNLHYSWFGGKAKEFKCVECSASASDLDVIKVHTTKVHKSKSTKSISTANQASRSSYVGKYEASFKFDRNGRNGPPKAKRALYLDADNLYGSDMSYKGSQNYETNMSRSKLHVPDDQITNNNTGPSITLPSLQYLANVYNFKPTVGYQYQDRTMVNAQNSINDIIFKSFEGFLTPPQKNQNSKYTSHLTATYNPYRSNPSTFSVPNTKNYWKYTQMQLFSSQFESPANFKLYISLLSLSPKYKSVHNKLDGSKYDVISSASATKPTSRPIHQQYQPMINYTQTTKMNSNLSILSPVYKDTNNNKVSFSQKSGLSSVEDAIRNLQNRVYAGNFQP